MRAVIPLLALLVFTSALRADDMTAADARNSSEAEPVLGTYMSKAGAVKITSAGYGALFVAGAKWQSVGFYQDSSYAGMVRRMGPDHRPILAPDQGLLYFRLQPNGLVSAELGWTGTKASIADLWTRVDKSTLESSRTRPISSGPVTPQPEERRVVVAPPTPSESGSPKFGDYVYVEELPEAITKVPPIYPDEARGKGVDGVVLVQALVRKDGSVGDVKVVKSIPLLDAAAMEAVRQWTFKPALSKGQPVEVWVAVPVKFPAP